MIHKVSLFLCLLLGLYSFTSTALAQQDRLAMMMEDCQRHLDLDRQTCQCIFVKSLDTNLSNVDLSFYYGAIMDKIAPEQKIILGNLQELCESDPSIPAPTNRISPPDEAEIGFTERLIRWFQSLF